MVWKIKPLRRSDFLIVLIESPTCVAYVPTTQRYPRPPWLGRFFTLPSDRILDPNRTFRAKTYVITPHAPERSVFAQ